MRNDEIDDQLQETENLSFGNKMQKSRAMKKLKSNLPNSPLKQAAVIAAFLDDKNSPAVKILENKKSDSFSRRERQFNDSVICP